MTRTVEGIEDLSLDQAAEILGTKTTKDTVNAALKDVVRRRLVAQFFDEMRSKDPKDLEETRVEAWQ